VPRTRAHLCIALAAWPLLTAVGTAVALTRLPYYALPAERAVAAALGGTVLAAPDLLIAALLWFGLSLLIFRRAGAEPRPGWRGVLRLSAEPLLVFAAVTWGAALWYPALLAEPLLAPLANLPVLLALAVLTGLVVLGAMWTGRPGRRAGLAAALLACGLIAPLPLHARTWAESSWRGTPPSLAVIGLDSLSHSDPVEGFRDWAVQRGGTWYERPVAPGLLTNPVWASILTMQPVRSHGVFHTFQPLPDGKAPLLEAASARGYRTLGVFPDQLTSAPGAEAGFDENRSGPVGWRQLLLPIVANNSVIVPLVRPLLPAWWPSSMTANQAGTYTYDLRRDVRSVLRSGRTRERVLVAAHLTYAHVPAYPRSIDMTWGELRRVAAARAGTVRDRSFDWQDRDRTGDPIPLRQWKVARLQAVVAAEVDRSGLLEAGGGLVLFSDHGDRVGLTSETFIDSRYHHVLLATFGLPARCPANPVSLLDIGYLAGLSSTRGEPLVEFAVAPPALWPQLVNSARLRWSGHVELDAALLDRIFGDLRRHDPWPGLARACPPDQADGTAPRR
jgi:hypothetical protein